MAENGGPRRRRAAQNAGAPERVTQAAEAMHQRAPSGLQRSYVPSQQGSYSVPNAGQSQNAWQNGYPNGYPQQNGAYPGYEQQTGYSQPVGYQQQMGYGQPAGYGQPPEGTRGQAQQTGQTRRYQTASYGAVTGHRGYVAIREDPPAQPPQKKKKKKNWVAVILSLLAVAALGTGGTLAALSYSKTRQLNDKVEPYNQLFVPGVYVDGIHLGGMTPEQALNSVESQIRQRNDAWRVQLTYQNTVLAEINADMLGMSVDIGEIMNNAWLQGHTGDYEQRAEAMDMLAETPYQAYTAIPSGDTSVITSLLANIKSRIDTPAVDAALVSIDATQPYPFIFSEESTGLSLDVDPIVTELYRMVATLKSGNVEIQPQVIEPRVTVNDLRKHYMLRSSVYTPISTSSTPERNDNIRKAFEKINGYVLDPGQKFSFNSVVGERSEENGFLPAEEYAYGEHVMGIGGGVCQASTTLYQAAVCAGMDILERRPHSDAVNYTEYGKDATVYWMYKRKVDFVFRNSSDEPLYIFAAVQTDPSNKRRLIARVSMYGQDMGDVWYQLESETVEEIPPPENPEYVKDKQATYVTYTDQQKSVSKAKPGYVVQSYRLEYSGNVLTERKPLYKDTYEPKAEKVYVGVTRREQQ